jgi:hypothetical protein
LTPSPIGDIFFARDKGCFKFPIPNSVDINAELWALLRLHFHETRARRIEHDADSYRPSN